MKYRFLIDFVCLEKVTKLCRLMLVLISGARFKVLKSPKNQNRHFIDVLSDQSGPLRLVGYYTVVCKAVYSISHNLDKLAPPLESCVPGNLAMDSSLC